MCQNTVLGPVYGKETTKSEDPKSSSKQVNKEKSSSSRKERSPSSGKRAFDGGQGSSSSGTNDKKRRMGAKDTINCPAKVMKISHINQTNQCLLSIL